jgi:hypothetical protein
MPLCQQPPGRLQLRDALTAAPTAVPHIFALLQMEANLSSVGLTSDQFMAKVK